MPGYVTAMSMTREALARTRPAGNLGRPAALWRAVCRLALQRYVEATDTVAELDAAPCQFLNNIHCERKVAIGAHEGLPAIVGPGVTPIVGDVPSILSRIGDGTVNVVFTQEFLARLRDKDLVLSALGEIHRILVPGGRLIVLQPNIRVASRRYWDVFARRVALSDASLAVAVAISGFQVVELRPRFLPAGVVGRWLATDWLARLYVAFRPLQRLCGTDMLLVASRPQAAAPVAE